MKKLIVFVLFCFLLMSDSSLGEAASQRNIQFQAGTTLHKVTDVWSSDENEVIAGVAYHEKWQQKNVFRSSQLFITADVKRNGQVVKALLTLPSKMPKNGWKVGPLVAMKVPTVVGAMWNGIQLKAGTTYYVEQGKKATITTVSVQNETLHIKQQKLTVTKPVLVATKSTATVKAIVNDEGQRVPLVMTNIAIASDARRGGFVSYKMDHVISAIQSDWKDFSFTMNDRGFLLRNSNGTYNDKPKFRYHRWDDVDATINLTTQYVKVKPHINLGDFEFVSPLDLQVRLRIEDEKGNVVKDIDDQSRELMRAIGGYELPTNLAKGEYRLLLTVAMNGKVVATKAVKWYPYSYKFTNLQREVHVEWQNKKLEWQAFQRAVRELGPAEQVTARFLYGDYDKMTIGPLKTQTAKQWQEEYAPAPNAATEVSLTSAAQYKLSLLNQRSALLDGYQHWNSGVASLLVEKGTKLELVQSTLERDKSWTVIRLKEAVYNESSTLPIEQSSLQTYTVEQNFDNVVVGMVFDDDKVVIRNAVPNVIKYEIRTNAPVKQWVYLNKLFARTVPVGGKVLESKVAATVQNGIVTFSEPVSVIYQDEVVVEIKQGEKVVAAGPYTNLAQLAATLPKGSYELQLHLYNDTMINTTAAPPQLYAIHGNEHMAIPLTIK